MVARVIAGVLLAPGAYTEAELARANEALSALGRPPLADSDCVADTPERLAPAIPSEHARRGRWSCSTSSRATSRSAAGSPTRTRSSGTSDTEDAAAPRTGPASVALVDRHAAAASAATARRTTRRTMMTAVAVSQ